MIPLKMFIPDYISKPAKMMTKQATEGFKSFNNLTKRITQVGLTKIIRNLPQADIMSRIYLATSLGIDLSKLTSSPDGIKRLSGCIAWITSEKISVKEIMEETKGT